VGETRGDPLAAVGPWPVPMDNPIRPYAWGSRTRLARLQGRVPDGVPEAELWMGAHPDAPSLLVPDGGPPLALDELVRIAPDAVLGAAVHRAFGPRLPYLVKVLAVEHPLSLQVHRQDKPELVYALQPLDVLAGFRSPEAAADLLTRHAGARGVRVAELLSSSSGGGTAAERLHAALAALVEWPDDDRVELTGSVLGGARAALAAGGLPGAEVVTLAWVARLAVRYPGDPMVAAPYLLELVRLAPGDVLFVPPGSPHSHLYGTALEVMANSDSVLRAGLTTKPVAPRELLAAVDGASRPVLDVPWRRVSPHEVLWRPPVTQFQLSRLRLDSGTPVHAYPFLAGPQVMVCTAGAVGIACGTDAIALAAGESAFVGAGGGPVTVAGPGEVFRIAPA